MLMKKWIVLLALCIVGIPLLFAGNLQKIHPLSSPIYELIDFLYISQGLALPSTSRPYSSAEVHHLLDRINYGNLSKIEREAYDSIRKEAQPPAKVFSFSFPLSLEAYIHTNIDDFTKPEDWIRGYEERRPLVDIILETWPGDGVYGFTSYPIVGTKFTGPYQASDLYGTTAFQSNLRFFGFGKEYNASDWGVPYRAFASLGGSTWNITIGREKAAWGPGVSGNFMIDEHLTYHNLGRYTAFKDAFKYTLLLSFFPHPSLYYTKGEGPESFNKNHTSSHNILIDGINMFIGHRLEWRFFRDSMGFVISESIMYQSKENYLDLSILSPTMVFHNLYIRQNANSILAFEFDYSPMKHLNIYTQIAIDEFALPGEENGYPSAMAYMLGVKGTLPQKDGYLFGSLEGVYTDPYLYLRDDGNLADGVVNQGIGEYGINWIVAIKRLYSNSSIFYEEDFIGYPHGGDAVVLNANLGYRKIGRWNAGGNLFLMWHGTFDKWTLWSVVGGAGNEPVVTAPTTSHPGGNKNNRDSNAKDRDSASLTFALSAYGSYTCNQHLELFGQIDLVHIRHADHYRTTAPITDLQTTLGVTWRF